MLPGVNTGGGGFTPSSSTNATGQASMGPVTVGGLNMGPPKADPWATAAKWGVIALAIAWAVKTSK